MCHAKQSTCSTKKIRRYKGEIFARKIRISRLLQKPFGRLSAPLLVSLIAYWVLATAPANAGEALVAVATNFAEVMDQLQVDFESKSDHRLTVTAGSTGKLYAQIKNGAPYDVLLAADQERPRLLQSDGNAVRNSRFTYAIGQLTLWSPSDENIAADAEMTLRRGEFHKLAIANPALAPYGAAAREALESLNLYDRLRSHVVMGENVGQAYAMVATGNADLGFISLSYVLSSRNEMNGSRWDVPQYLYSPIRQDAVLLIHAKENRAAQDFVNYLKQDRARSIIRRFGYGLD